MRKNVLIISSSPRKGGNSETLAASFAKGAQDAGNHVETVWLREKQIGFCTFAVIRGHFTMSRERGEHRKCFQ